jgi:geranylgeranyl pyrophosphate synthase
MNALSSQRWPFVILLYYAGEEPFNAFRTPLHGFRKNEQIVICEDVIFRFPLTPRIRLTLESQSPRLSWETTSETPQRPPYLEQQEDNRMRTSVPAAQCMNTLNTEQFADAFNTFLPLPAGLDPPFEESLRYVFDNPGSLVRPRMVFQVATAYGLDAAPAKDLAIALEYFHTASLVFDDLPCMDNASDRRGVACVHFAFGEAGAILTALALINRAYALSWRAVAASSQQGQPRALAYIEQCLGVQGLLNGQSLDLHYATLPHNRETTERVARGKTVSLIRLTLVLPAMLGGASEREIQLLERIALYWGLAYQMVDDLKDLLASTAEAGKTVARDMLLDRPNVASVMGIPGAVHRLTRFLHLGDRTLGHLLKSRPEMTFLEKLRGDLEEELDRVTQNACVMPSGEQR